MGLDKWNHNGLWEFFYLPQGIDSEIAINSILAECAELELIYPSYDTMRKYIGIWSRRRYPIWEKLLNTTKLEYNPIENYDRTEEWLNTETGTTNKSIDNTTSSSVENSSEGSSTSTTTLSVHGYDNGELVEKEQTTVNSNDTVDTVSNGDSNSNTTEHNTSNNTLSRAGRAHGNIGVTTTQQMIREEREIVDFDIYNKIVRDFMFRFCIMVW